MAGLEALSDFIAQAGACWNLLKLPSEVSCCFLVLFQIPVLEGNRKRIVISGVKLIYAGFFAVRRLQPFMLRAFRRPM